MPSSTTWMDPEGIVLSEITQTEKGKANAVWFHLNVISEKQNKWTHNRNRLIGHSDGCQMGGGLREWVEKVKGVRGTNL